VAFRDASKLADQAQLGTNDANTLALDKDLRATKAQLQAATDQLEAYIEDMKSTTEEYQAVTEELQSSNEELETAKEELQSVNEELQTINGELQSKNDAMERLNSDLKNLLDSTQIATVFLDDNLRIKHYTPMMERLFSLRDGDRGRPITDFVTQLAYNELRNDVQKVQSTLTIVERALDLKDGAGSFLMRIRPYRTLQNVVDGVVITFSDLTANKQAQRTKELLIEELQHRTRNLLAVVQSISDATLAAAGSLDDYAAEFNSRLQALSRVQGILSRQEDATVTLTEIVQAELTGVGVTPDGERIVIGGPPVTLPRETTQLLALAIHELATNALKHGVLKGARGRLDVKWRVLEQTGQPHLQLTWLESDVELCEQKAGSLRQGFGQELLEKAIPYQLSATTRFELLKDGMRWRLDMPLREYKQL
jgi:two-component system CheB/CheR fusion protein